MSAQYSATLTSFHTASPDRDPYTIYVITVKRGAQQWQVFRRYREVLPRRARTPGQLAQRGARTNGWVRLLTRARLALHTVGGLADGAAAADWLVTADAGQDALRADAA